MRVAPPCLASSAARVTCLTVNGVSDASAVRKKMNTRLNTMSGCAGSAAVGCGVLVGAAACAGANADKATALNSAKPIEKSVRLLIWSPTSL